MTHRQAVLVMVAAALMWSIAGVVTRHLQTAHSFEVTFWRSAFNALALVVLLCALRGPRVLWASLRGGGQALWVSGVCWAVMFTAFMLVRPPLACTHLVGHRVGGRGHRVDVRP
jgi:EamA domain-containing membrane protein RarD